jgi:hypothetical protein
MSYYGQQPASTSAESSNLFGDMQSSEGRKLYTELTGVDMNTFSNNATFSVPRFLQDNFVADATSAYPSQSASSSNSQQHTFGDLDMDYNQCVLLILPIFSKCPSFVHVLITSLCACLNLLCDDRPNPTYDNSYGNTAVAPSGSYPTLRFPTAPMFPSIPMPAPPYPNANISPVDMMGSSVPPK